MKRILPLLLLAAALAGSQPSHAATTLIDVRYTMDDGVKLAADVYLPAGEGPFPCVVELTPYRKESRAAEGASFLPGIGIALIEVDARGTGGSQGEYDIVFSMREQLDTAAIIEQSVAAIPGRGDLCLDKIGMYGGSYSGIIQYLVASLPDGQRPEHLAAIAPARAYGDLYRDIVYHGGMVIGSFGEAWSAGTTAYYTEPPTDMPGDDAVKAWSDHLTKNDPMMLNYLNAPFADASFTSNGTNPAFTQKLYEDSSTLQRIGNLHVPTLHLAGWYDAFTRGQLLTFQKALEQEDATHGPNYLVVGPWNHGNTHFITPENLPGLKQMLGDWYLHWLADAPAPAFMSGPRVQYYQVGKGQLLDTDGAWRSANSWPLPDAQYQRMYLRSGNVLSAQAPTGAEPDDVYAYNPAAGTGEIMSRWDNAVAGVVYQQWDQRTDEPKGLTYSTAPYASDFAIAGTINLHMVASTIGLPGAPDPVGVPAGLTQLTPPYHDTDFVVKLSDVAPDGTSTLITQGYLRASHRALDETNTERAGNGDVIRAQHEDTEASLVAPDPHSAYDIEIWPTAKTFRAGHSLRIAIYSADTPNHLTLLKPALNTVHHSAGAESSWLLLPVVPS